MMSTRLLGGTMLTLLATIVCAQTPEQRAHCQRDYAPSSGQGGKDVVWVPTPDFLVTAMLKEAGTTANDLVYDLGAGDGKIAIAAAKEFGARAVGVEYNPDMVKLATCLVNAAGVGDKAKVIQGDIFQTDFSAATVVTMYLLPDLNERLIPTLLKMKPGTRIVSNSFTMGDWTPDRKIQSDGISQGYFWKVPAQVEGMWTLQSGDGIPFTVRLRQTYQTIEGVVNEGSKLVPIQNASLSGENITFTYEGANGPVTLTGKVERDRLDATVKRGQKTSAYRGTRS
jgi:SAM-dependent methyltransferase